MNDVSFETLYEQLHQRLFRFVASRVDDSAEAEDIVQEVFLRIHTHLESVREMERLEAWIFQVARNSLIDAYRRKRRVEPLVDYPVEDDHSEPDASEELIPYLREIVQGLPEPYREALILTEYQGLSQVEMASRLGISLSGAKSRVQRARQKVKEIMLACCHIEFDRRGLICCYRACCPSCEVGETV
jgi:RNA polymerase sigma-70 factor (ECF subfamily)